MRTKRFAALAAALLLAGASQAIAAPKVLDPTWCSVGQPSAIDATSLMRALLQSWPISDESRQDAHGDITTSGTYYAIEEIYRTGGKKGRFTSDSDKQNATAIYDFFDSPRITDQLNARVDFEVLGADGVPIAVQDGIEILNAWNDPATVSQYTIGCLHPQTPPPPTASIFDRVRVRGNGDDLIAASIPPVPAVGVPLGNSSASASWQRDEVAKAVTFKAQGAVGLRYALSDDPLAGLQIVMPYASINRANSDDPKKKAQNVNNLAAGVGVAGALGTNTDTFVWQIRPEIDSDDSFRSAIGYLSARVDTAHIDGVYCLEHSEEIVQDALWLSCDLAGIADFGTVFDSGGLANIRKIQTYERLGYFTGISLAGDQDSDFWQHISLVADYKTMWDYSGNRQDMGRFESQLAYKISPPKPGTATNPALNFQIALQYIDGRADVTRQRERQWLLSLGMQY